MNGNFGQVLSALPDNIPVWSNPNYWENTCRASPPNLLGDKSGRIWLLPGQEDGVPYLNKVIGRPIYDANGSVMLDPALSGEYEMTTPDYLRAHTDNALVRAKDGNFYALKAAFNFGPVSNPTTWQKFLQADNRGSDGPKAGGRGSNAVWRSSEPSGLHPIGALNWNIAGVVDPFVFAGGKYSYSRAFCGSQRLSLANYDLPCADPKGPYHTCAGSDRPELYACPFTGYLYVTAYYTWGAYKDASGAKSDAYNRMLVLCSPNYAKDWYVLDDAISAWAPLVMTSTPNGRLFLLQWTQSSSTIYCSNLFDWTKGELPKVFRLQGPKSHAEGNSNFGYSIDLDSQGSLTYVESWSGKQLAFGGDADLAVRQIHHPSISRVSTDQSTNTVRFSYRVLNEAGRQSYAILNVDVVDVQGQPQIKDFSRVVRLSAQASTTHSMILGTFVDPDYLTMPHGMQSNAALFYWLEMPAKSSPDPSVQARGAIFENKTYFNPMVLSVSAGESRSWQSTDPGGDYMTGGFYYWKGLNYVAQWREPDGIRANIVTYAK